MPQPEIQVGIVGDVPLGVDFDEAGGEGFPTHQHLDTLHFVNLYEKCLLGLVVVAVEDPELLVQLVVLELNDGL